ncbi:50S ribosomal protein L18 [Candidatus Norongarragalina meridionalis]|nr:50S ribosomal protein L18 [Candidatus Norongarragalina meridionalis]
MSKATGPLYCVHFRRRRENRTNYRKRLALLKSGLPRAVIRKSNKYILVQVANFEQAGDRVLCTASSKELDAFGFKGAKNNSPAAYLTGLLAARKSLKKGVKEAVPDIGLNFASKGCVLFAALKGVADGGVAIGVSDEKAPSNERIAGKHLSETVQKEFAEAKKKIEAL